MSMVTYVIYSTIARISKCHDIERKNTSLNKVWVSRGPQVGKEQVDPLHTEKKLGIPLSERESF